MLRGSGGTESTGSRTEGDSTLPVVAVAANTSTVFSLQMMQIMQMPYPDHTDPGEGLFCLKKIILPSLGGGWGSLSGVTWQLGSPKIKMSKLTSPPGGEEVRSPLSNGTGLKVRHIQLYGKKSGIVRLSHGRPRPLLAAVVSGDESAFFLIAIYQKFLYYHKEFHLQP